MSNSENTMNDPALPPYPATNTQDPCDLPLPSHGVLPDVSSKNTALLPCPSAPSPGQQNDLLQSNLPYTISPNVNAAFSATCHSDNPDPPKYEDACLEPLPNTMTQENGHQPPSFEEFADFSQMQDSAIKGDDGAWCVEGLFPERKLALSKSTGIYQN